MTDTITLKQAVGIILEGFTLPDAARKILETAYFAEATLEQQAEQAKEELHGCACRWDADDNRVATCVRHQGWLDVVQEWSERAKAAEATQVAQQAEQVPPTDKELFKIYCADVSAGDWHPPSSNYYAGFHMGWKMATAPKGGA